MTPCKCLWNRTCTQMSALFYPFEHRLYSSTTRGCWRPQWKQWVPLTFYLEWDFKGLCLQSLSWLSDSWGHRRHEWRPHPQLLSLKVCEWNCETMSTTRHLQSHVSSVLNGTSFFILFHFLLWMPYFSESGETVLMIECFDWLRQILWSVKKSQHVIFLAPPNRIAPPWGRCVWVIKVIMECWNHTLNWEVSKHHLWERHIFFQTGKLYDLRAE